MSYLIYPQKHRPAGYLFEQSVFNKMTSYILNWQQGLGEYGLLHLHACWSETSSIARGYHGQTVGFYYNLLKGFIALCDKTENPEEQHLKRVKDSGRWKETISVNSRDLRDTLQE